MSREVVTEVYSRTVGSMIRKAVLAYMGDRANDDGSGVWCSKQRIANEIEASRQAVITCIKGLLEDGLLLEVGKRKCSNGYTMEYSINVNQLKLLPRIQKDGPRRKNIDPSKSGPVKEDYVKTSTSFTQTVLEPSKTTVIKDEPLSAKDWFDEFEKVLSFNDFPNLASGWSAKSHQWMAGFDLHKDCIPVIKRLIKGKTRGSIHSWGYFEQAIADHQLNRLKPIPEGNTNDKPNNYSNSNQRKGTVERTIDLLEGGGDLPDIF